MKRTIAVFALVALAGTVPAAATTVSEALGRLDELAHDLHDVRTETRTLGTLHGALSSSLALSLCVVPRVYFGGVADVSATAAAVKGLVSAPGGAYYTWGTGLGGFLSHHYRGSFGWDYASQSIEFLWTCARIPHAGQAIQVQVPYAIETLEPGYLLYTPRTHTVPVANPVAGNGDAALRSGVQEVPVAAILNDLVSSLRAMGVETSDVAQVRQLLLGGAPAAETLQALYDPALGAGDRAVRAAASLGGAMVQTPFGRPLGQYASGAFAAMGGLATPCASFPQLATFCNQLWAATEVVDPFFRVIGALADLRQRIDMGYMNTFFAGPGETSIGARLHNLLWSTRWGTGPMQDTAIALNSQVLNGISPALADAKTHIDSVHLNVIDLVKLPGGKYEDLFQNVYQPIWNWLNEVKPVACKWHTASRTQSFTWIPGNPSCSAWGQLNPCESLTPTFNFSCS